MIFYVRNVFTNYTWPGIHQFKPYMCHYSRLRQAGRSRRVNVDQRIGILNRFIRSNWITTRSLHLLAQVHGSSGKRSNTFIHQNVVQVIR